MEVGKLIRSLRVQLDKVSSSAVADFKREHYLFYLDLAILSFIKTRFERNNIYKTGFETSVKRLEDLRVPIAQSQITLTRNGEYDWDSNFKVLIGSMPLDHFLFINVLASTAGKCVGSAILRPTTHDELPALLIDPFNRPKGNRALYLFRENFIEFYVDPAVDLIAYGRKNLNQGAVINQIVMTYIKTPPKLLDISDDSANFVYLPDTILEEVVNIAENLMTVDIEAKKIEMINFKNLKQE
jgi:hypothetical protein